MARKTGQESFEDLYAKLEDTVARLEAGGLSLDDSIALYEQGMELARRCQERLDEAEQKITTLKESFAPVSERPTNGRVLNDDLAEYEYVPEESELPIEDTDPFA